MMFLLLIEGMKGLILLIVIPWLVYANITADDIIDVIRDMDLESVERWKAREVLLGRLGQMVY
jgi:hypothetical protein